MKSKASQIKLIFTLILMLLAVVFVVLNTNNVAINFGLFKLKLPLIIILVIMIIIGVLIGYFWGSYGHNQDKNN
ncbi:lipopolysaccharide assembly protein LapA domain-containing protein [uncultured Lactobacillus sp.]|uniref:lipopolysaccharide assembly protein LapA domain-containing protein n=1 Tax=uncultured Lactobacillus sp. TaxID=153152 RepID=UPI0025F8B7FF|nr:lipopolysaccharide assembly protein LapA domain-containing protein [uncultured Lactobacillus sp.]